MTAQPDDLDDVISELAREVTNRENAYTKWVAEKKPGWTQEAADKKIYLAKKAEAICRRLQKAGGLAHLGRLIKLVTDAGGIEAVEKATKLAARIEERGGPKRIGLALNLLEMCEENPQALVAVVGDEAVGRLLEAFPGSKLEISLNKEAA